MQINAKYVRRGAMTRYKKYIYYFYAIMLNNACIFGSFGV